MTFDAFSASSSFGHPRQHSPAFQKAYVGFSTSSIDFSDAAAGTSSVVLGSSEQKINLYGIVFTNDSTSPAGGFIQEASTNLKVVGITSSISGPVFWTVENPLQIGLGEDLEFNLLASPAGANLRLTVIYTYSK